MISDREELKGIFQSYLMPMDELRNLSCAELLKQRQNLAMELLWIQQAITSRTEVFSECCVITRCSVSFLQAFIW